MISTPLVLYFFGAIIVSFICSLLEATILSTTPAYIEQLCDKGLASGHRLRKLRDKIDHPLIAILTLNTVANMFGAAGVGNEAGKLARAQGVTDNEALWVSLASGVLTLSILIFAEIVPKTLGAVYWRTIAAPASFALLIMVRALSPVVVVLQFIPRLITGSSGISVITREDLRATAQIGHQEGVLPDREARIIANILRLHEIQVRKVLTPRVSMFTLQEDLTAAQTVRPNSPLRSSRIPVYDEPDNFTGLVLRAEIHQAIASGKGDTPLKELRKAVRYEPETKPLALLLESFISEGDHLRLVVDEHGAVEGLVTLEDVIETLIGGEIMDELDLVDDLQKLARARSKGGKTPHAKRPKHHR